MIFRHNILILLLCWLGVPGVAQARDLPECTEVLTLSPEGDANAPFEPYRPLAVPGAWGGSVGCYVDGAGLSFYGERLGQAEGQERLIEYGSEGLSFLTRAVDTGDDWRLTAICTRREAANWGCTADLTLGGGPVLSKVFNAEGVLVRGRLAVTIREGVVPLRFLEFFDSTAASNRQVLLSLADGSQEWRLRPDEPGGRGFILSLAEHPEVLEALYRPAQPLELRVLLDRTEDGRRQELTFRREIPLSDLRLVLTHLSQMETLSAAGFERSKEIEF